MTVTIPALLRDLLQRAGAESSPLLISYADADGHQKPSFRGSTHVHSEGQLAGWIRNPKGSLQNYLAEGAPVQVIYRNPRADAFLRIAGFARLATDAATRNQVFDDAAPHEQAADPQRLGVAMVIDVERVAGYVKSETVLIEHV